MKPRLDNINILLADSDPQIARVVTLNLREMGFRRVEYVRDATEALAHITTKPVDILITEWLLEPMDGIELVRHLRLSRNSPNRSIPIIMLTGKGEYVDVTTARDVGITEFLVKPFTVQTLFDRLEHLVDHPRPFILSENFAGPDRRRKGAPPDGMEKRVTRPREGKKFGKHLPAPEKTPQIFPADHEIKRAIGLIGPLATIITPDMLQAAQ
ncbi:MAG TPA: response regulator, partial [Alphaproteobacteria bacterium]|nr:response regulator [Alphaproteobacteria bacterium]